MKNIYEFGSEKIQTEPNFIWKEYELILDKLGLDDSQNKSNKKIGAKGIGAIIAELFRKNIEVVLKRKYSNSYKISENNVYVKGCHIEFDFLILKGDAKKETITHNEITFEIPVYNLKDVIAVIESKTYGIYSLYDRNKRNFEKNDLFKFVNAYKNDLNGMDNKIKIGYMSLAEQRPNKGVSNFIEKTIYFFEDYFGKEYYEEERLWNVYYAKCRYANNTSDVFADESEWEKFVDSLVK